MTEIQPTFRSNKDRAVYLLAEYKTPITLTFLAVGIWVAWARPELPTPPQSWVTFSLAWAGLSVPAYYFGIRISRWLKPHEWVFVAIADDGDPYLYDGYRIPPEIWEDVTVVGGQPFEPDEGVFDYVVTRMNYYEDLDELEVRGCERADLTPGEALQSAARVDEYYEHHHRTRRRYSRLKATVRQYATEIHDLTIMRITGQHEQAAMDLDKSVAGLIEEMENEVDDLPDGPENEIGTHGQQLDAQLDELEIEAVPEPERNGHDVEPEGAEIHE